MKFKPGDKVMMDPTKAFTKETLKSYKTVGTIPRPGVVYEVRQIGLGLSKDGFAIHNFRLLTTAFGIEAGLSENSFELAPPQVVDEETTKLIEEAKQVAALID